MALSLQLGYPSVPKSITNKNVSTIDALDNANPMAFLTFIKIIDVSFEPDSLQSYYNYYLKEWNNLSNSLDKSNSDIIVDKYREFLKDISLNYTTLEEKQFLSKVDFDDPFDLDVVMGFYSRKLKELSLSYNNKRNDIKFNIVRNKLIGTNFGSEKTITEIILSYLKTLDDGKILYDYDKISKDLEVELDELYDLYPSYYNQTPDPTIYDNKDLDYGYNIFLTPDDVTISTVLSGFSQELQDLKEVDDLLDNKRKLTEKYMSTDFYYLSTGNTVSEFLSGKLFSAANPILNFTNRDYPTTASTQRTDYLNEKRSVGFFRPHKQSIILVDGDNYSYSINLENLKPNSLYFFADPEQIGKNGDVLTFIVDDSRLKRNYSSGVIANQPYSTPDDTKTYGYISKIEPYESKYLDSVFDQGSISDIKRDIYGNTFGQFVNSNNFKSTITSTNDQTNELYGVIINGHMFYDTIYWEGYNFDYTVSNDTQFNETIRTGLSTTTAPFNSSDVDLTLFFGYFKPYTELSEFTDSNLVTTYEILDGAFITNYDLSLYPDTTSSDLSSFDFLFTVNLSAFDEDGGLYSALTTETEVPILDEYGEEIYATIALRPSFYYDTLIDGGIYTGSPLQRALLDPLYPSISANLTESTKTSALEITDGGDIGISFPSIDYSSSNYIYIDDVYSPTQYSTPSLSSDNLNGTILIKNSSNREVSTLLEAMPFLADKYQSPVLIELDNNILKFDISNDIILIKTPSYFNIFKLLYIDGEFVDSKKVVYSLTHSTGNFDKISNTFRNKMDIFYYKLVMSDIVDNTITLYPEIYKYDTINAVNTKIFPRNAYDISSNTSFFSITGGNVRYTSSDSPTLTYSSRNNIFNASFLLKDQNDMFTLHELDFSIDPNVKFLSHNIKYPNVDHVSNIFSTIDNLTVFLSSSGYYIDQETLVI